MCDDVHQKVYKECPRVSDCFSLCLVIVVFGFFLVVVVAAAAVVVSCIGFGLVRNCVRQ